MSGRLFLVGALFIGLACPLKSQDYRAKVQGIVTDPSHALVTGAKVTLQNTSTGVAVSAESNTTGLYRFDFVEPGSYTLTVEMPGFSKFVQQNLRIEARGDVTVDPVLTLGNATSLVTVADEPVALEFNSATLAVSATRQMVQEIPVGNRNPLTLALLDPSVTNANGEGRNLAEGVNNVLQPMNFIFTGTRAGQLDIVLDGQSALIGPIDANNPSKDAVQEIVVQENTTDAEFGRSAGGVISLVSRTGTNEWHGDVQYTGQNPSLNAAQDIITHAQNPHRDNFWGATVGSPIRKNKLFTLNSYEGRRQILPFQQLSTNPTALERQGNFSQSLTFNGAQRTIYDPATTVFNVANNTSTRTPFAGNIIPAIRIDPTAARIMQYVWAPNNPGQNLAGLNNYAKNYGVQGKYVNFLNRTDWNVSDKLRLYGRVNATEATFAQSDLCRSDLQSVVPSAKTCIARADATSGVSEQRGVTGDAIYSLSSTMFLDLRFNWGRASSIGTSDSTEIGEQGMKDLWGGNNWFGPYVNPKVLPAVRFPAISFSGALSLGSASYWIRRGRDIDVVPKISWQHGKHYLKLGFEFHRMVFDSFWPTEGTFTAAPADTASTFINPNTANNGDPYAAFLVGAVSGNFGVAAPLSLSENFVAGFVQDDVKISRRFTLNLGLRWEASLGLSDAQDQLTSRVDLTAPIPALKANPAQIPSVVAGMLASTGAPQDVTTGGLYFAGSNPNNVTEPRKLFYGGLGAFQPRIGMAVRVSNKTSVRFGYSRWVLPPDRQTNIYSGTTANGQTIPVYGYSARSTMLPSLNGVPQASLSDPFPANNPLILPSGNSLGLYTQLGSAASFIHNDYQLLTNDRISVAVSRQLPLKIVVDVSYLFNFGRNLSGSGENLNFADPAITYKYQAQTSVTVANPFYHYLTPAQFPGSLRNQATVPISTLLSPYPQYTTLTENNTPGVENRAHAAHVTVKRPFAEGFQGQFSYNYGYEKAGMYFNAPDQFAHIYTLQPLTNPRHRISAVIVSELPFGRGKRFLTNANRALDALVGGWIGDANLLWHSGSFLSFGQANVGCSPVLPNPTGQQWFNTACVTRVANPTFQPRTNPLIFGGLTGPSYRQLDATVGKKFQLTEKRNFEVRLEAYNLTNSVMWGNPGTTPASATFALINSQANIGRWIQYTARINF